MLKRCLDPSYRYYRDYGGRGITVCNRWLKFENFYADMGERPDGLSLDRRDNDGNYDPDNCRWASKLEQARNKRKTVFISAFGTTKRMVEWAEHYGINYGTLKWKLRQGTPAEEALSSIDGRILRYRNK